MSDRERSGPEYADVTLAVIAGGKGERLGGVAKGLLELEGRTVLERVLELGRLCGDVLLGTNEPGPYERFHLRTVGDVVRGRGAPGGVHAALVGARTEWVLAVACDMPFVSEAAVRVLLDARSPEVDAVCFTVGGRVEPLLALYRRTLSDEWGEALKKEEPSLRALLSRCRTKHLPEEALRAVDAELRAVVSVNTPEDLARHGVSRPPSPPGPPANTPPNLPSPPGRGTG
ncbi:MAG TPA: molybdenum cofactor guanylyltransferase [Archangium sp.]|uniref:molybdenum cofactor guanylyltransferase n=1 Tax=Archangium sp. TaxID=1872627 RepID=UPI002E31142F|nr:molybdenum cofactor guanylyltransferase [Archangium sp.]HEX5751208.1 molybdenum cofactor guanylyltransferase [Archangium sp.]